MKSVQKITAIILCILFCISMAYDTVHAGDEDQTSACTIRQELDVSSSTVLNVSATVFA